MSKLHLVNHPAVSLNSHPAKTWREYNRKRVQGPKIILNFSVNFHPSKCLSFTLTMRSGGILPHDFNLDSRQTAVEGAAGCLLHAAEVGGGVSNGRTKADT